MNRLFFTSLLLCFTIVTQAQNPFPGRGTAFQDEIVPRVDIEILPASIDAILAPGNEESNEEYEAIFYFTDADEVDTVTNIGFRLRGNTSRFADKKSFKVSFNTFIQGEDWKGLEKLNLNGEHNDPTISRAKICWDMLKDMRVPAPRANHVELYINGEYRGLYANVEHIDEEFVERRFGNKDGNLYKCLYPADLAYLGEDPEAYKLAPFGRRAYDLRTNEEEDDYSDLAMFISTLNLTPLEDLPCELEALFNVDTYIRTMAFDVLSGNWDGYAYNQNNFYLYHNTATGRFEFIPYDLDNTLGIDWLSKDWGNRDVYQWPPSGDERPLFERLLEVPEYRARYTFYLESFMEDFFNPDELFPYFDEIHNLLQPFVAADDFYPLDYGFSMDDFSNGFEEELDYFQTDYGLKSYVTERHTTALNQLETLNMTPFLFAENSDLPTANQDLAFQVSVLEDEAIADIQLCYQLPGEEPVCFTMTDNGDQGDDAANDDRYGVIIPALNQATTIEWYITATDNEGATARLPRCSNFSLQLISGGISLAINEFMASNDETIADEEGEFDDWVEIHNYGAAPISLDGYYLSDDPENPTKWPFPDLFIEAGEFLLIWADDDEEQGSLHTSFKLNADGEYIGIYFAQAGGADLIDGIEFGPQESDAALGRLPNGTGAFQAVSPTPGASNEPISRIHELVLDESFQVYPNPMQESIQLSSDQEGQYQALLYDLQGRQLAAYQWNGRTGNWSPQLISGLYLLKVERDGKLVYSGKLLKS